jgi:hypothetical protein
VETTELLARESIRDLVARYNALGDAGRSAEVAELFAEDGTLEVGDRSGTRTVRGRDEIRRLFDATKSDWAANSRSEDSPPYVRHSVTTHVIDMLDPDHARGTSYVTVIRPSGLVSWGRYLDDYRKGEGRWLFASRRALADSRSAAASVIEHGTNQMHVNG